eukprot:TRINITY_DN6524_c0_g1_i2.p1 TRINITY_DN6524_c0_g1~~TRINITY_DN6524_c0_g1_i2.p1  ORF type:complete len:339 (+),score=76.56 TRINITY_DN6524_c0_g1_i2:85-1101(+)
MSLTAFRSALKLCSFNVLCPIYFRTPEDFGHPREAYSPPSWQHRNLKIIKALKQENFDVIGLQEYWCASPEYSELWERKMNDFNILTLRRTGRKYDGIALLISKKFNILGQKDIKFYDSGNRVALLASVDIANADNSKDQTPVVFGCTHLTFPHHEFDKRMRVDQSNKVIDAIDQFKMDMSLDPSTPVFLFGDFNGPPHDKAIELYPESNYASTFKIHNEDENIFTHVNHHCDQDGVDYIWVNSSCLGETGVLSCEVEKSGLMPFDINPQTPLLRPIAVPANELGSFTEESVTPPANFEEWCQVSDHRPIVSEVSLTKMLMENKQTNSKESIQTRVDI